jgi:hypothetical protein
MNFLSVFLFLGCVIGVFSTKPCCQGSCSTNGSGLAKYYSIDSFHNMCGECCMKPSPYPVYKLFEPGLTAANNSNPCAEKGYDNYSSTVTHGFGPVKMTLDLYGPSPALGSSLVALEATEPCCQGNCSADGSGLAKYYSIDTMHNMCGECCMKPSQYPLYKIFEPGLTAAGSLGLHPCAVKGYDNYSSTVTHGVWPVTMTLDLYGPSPSSMEPEALRFQESADSALDSAEEVAPLSEGTTEPCCQGDCALKNSTLAKYYSIDHIFNNCGECCMMPSQYPLYKIFEPGLTAAGPLGIHPCAQKGYGTYKSTTTHGFGPVKMTLDLYGPDSDEN